MKPLPEPVFLFIFIPENWAKCDGEKGSPGQSTQDSVVEDSCHSMYIMQKWILKKRIKHKLSAGTEGEGSRWGFWDDSQEHTAEWESDTKGGGPVVAEAYFHASRTSCHRTPRKLMVPGPARKLQDIACQGKTATTGRWTLAHSHLK